MYENMPDDYRQTLISELQNQHEAVDATKDILIVVHNQYDHLKKCLESIKSCTQNYNLYIWDNNSSNGVASLIKHYSPYLLATTNVNCGFIRPNNYLASLSSSEYLILVNSDVVVFPGWDTSMIGHLQKHNGIVGYQGGILDENCCGASKAWGEKVDYIAGWCMCFPRKIYEEIGLFDTNLKFAYGEDSDFCLRAQNKGYKLYALHLDYVTHVGSATISEVKKKSDVTTTFKQNHEFLKKKWNDYLTNGRVLTRGI